MKKMKVTLTVQIELDYDEADEEVYQEKLEMLIEDLEDMELKVDVESEEPVFDDEDDY